MPRLSLQDGRPAGSSIVEADSLAGRPPPGNTWPRTVAPLLPLRHELSKTSSVLETSCNRAVRYERISSLVLSCST